MTRQIECILPGARWALAALITAVSAHVALAQAPSGPPPANVEVDAARLEEVEHWRDVTGEIRSLRRSVLASEESGLVIELTVNEGDRVEQGQVIARLDDVVARIEVAQAEADVAARRGEIAEHETLVRQRQRDLARVRELVERASASGIELEDAQWGVELSEARLAQAKGTLGADEALLARAKDRLSKMVIHAPFGGNVVTKRTERGQWLERGDGVVELVSLEEIEARIDVPESVIKRLGEPGVLVRIAVPSVGVAAEGQITQIVPDADRMSRMFPVRVAVKNENGLLRPGMSVVGSVPVGRRERLLTVHKDAILRDDAGEYVYFNAGGQAMVARIERLFATRERVAVRAPTLQDGMQLVVKGNERLFPTQPLILLNAPASGATPGGSPPEHAPGAKPTEERGGG